MPQKHYLLPFELAFLPLAGNKLLVQSNIFIFNPP